VVVDPLAGFRRRLLLDGAAIPFVVPRTDNRRAVCFRQPVYVGYVESVAQHAFQRRLRRRRGGGHDVDRMVEFPAFRVGGVDDEVQHDGGAAEMRHPMIGNGVVDIGHIHAPQADVDAGDGGDRPGEAPAVAMEHRQRPQINRMVGHVPADDVADGVQIGAAVMIDHALGVAGGARREVERDGLPFVVGKMPVEVRVAFLQQRLIVLFAQPLAADVFVGLRVVDVDDNDIAPQVGQRLFDGFRELGVGNQHLGFAVVQDKGDGLGIEPVIERVQHGARHVRMEIGQPAHPVERDFAQAAQLVRLRVALEQREVFTQFFLDQVVIRQSRFIPEELAELMELNQQRADMKRRLGL